VSPSLNSSSPSLAIVRGTFFYFPLFFFFDFFDFAVETLLFILRSRGSRGIKKPRNGRAGRLLRLPAWFAAMVEAESLSGGLELVAHRQVEGQIANQLSR
jgi:hypothetical protein